MTSFKILQNAKAQIKALNNEYAGNVTNASGVDGVAGAVVNDIDTAKVNEYTAALAGLSKEQQELLLNTAALTEAERKSVLSNLDSIRSTNKQKLAFAAKKYNLDQATMSQQLALEANKNYSKSEIEAKIASSDFAKALTKQQQQQLAAMLATKGHSSSLKEWSANIALANYYALMLLQRLYGNLIKQERKDT